MDSGIVDKGIVKRGRLNKIFWAVALAVVMTPVTAIAAMAVVDSADHVKCPDQLRADEAKVRVKPWKDAEDLPDLGSYPEIHWQVRALGNPCSRVPGPTDWAYQGVIRLAPEAVATLMAKYTWQPITAPSSPGLTVRPLEIWPALAAFVPPEVQWVRSDVYDMMFPQTRSRNIYLDPERRLVLFSLFSH